MTAGWIDVEDRAGSRRVALGPGRTRIEVREGAAIVKRSGGGGASPAVVFWDRPPRVEIEGAGPPLVRAGVEERSVALADGDRIEWEGTAFVYGEPAAASIVEEEPAPAEPASAARAAPAARPASGELRAWRRIAAGLLVELGRAERATSARWQEAVRAGAFEEDACAAEVVASAGGIEPHLEPLLERSARLQRDLLMAPLLRGARGASRRARRAVQRGLAAVVGQLLVFGTITLVVIAALILARFHGFSIDGVFDRLLGWFDRVLPGGG